MSHYGSSSSVAVAGGMVEEPAKQFIAAPTFPLVGHSDSTSDVKQKQFESSFLAATSQFSLPFLDGVIDALRKLIRAEPLLDGECRNLSVLMEMTNLHLHLHYGHPLRNRNIGHDILNAVGNKGSDTVHAVVPLMNQGAEQSTLHVEANKVPSTINGTERSHEVDKHSSLDTAHQPYKKMRSSMPDHRHQSTVSQSLQQEPGKMNPSTSIHTRASSAEEVVRDISDPSNLTGDVSDMPNEKGLVIDEIHKPEEIVGNILSGVKNGSVVCQASSPNCRKSPRLNVCTLPGRSKNTDSDSDGDYELSTASSRDLQLDSDMECTVQGSDEEGQESENVLQLLQYHRDAFYKAFTPYYEVASKSSKLITDEKYAMIRDIIRTQKGKKEKPIIVKYRRLYSIVGNVEDRCLYRKNKVVTTFEKVFDVILEAHSRISHARNPKSNLSCITDTLGYYGVPIEAVKHFINTCPLVCIT